MFAHATGRLRLGQGGGSIALRAEKSTTRPYAALPHDLAGDPTIAPLEKAVLLALLFWARGKASCWPSDASIGRRVGKSVATVQRALRRLEGRGIIAREKTDANRTGRLIVLSWRTGDRPPAARAIDPPTAPVSDEGIVIVKGAPLKDLGEEISERRRSQAEPEPIPAPAPAPPAVDPVAPRPGRSIRRGQLATMASSDDPILRREAERKLAPPPMVSPAPSTVPELLARIRETPVHPAMAAEALAQDLDDRKSWAYLHSLCSRAWEGRLDPQVLVTAWREATSGRARNPGAVFMSVLKREQRKGPGATW